MTLFNVSPLDMGLRGPADNRTRRPRWESAASPASDPITVQILTTGEDDEPQPPTGVEILLPNIEYMAGFLLSGAGTLTGATFNRASLARSGIHVRIYRQRLSADLANYASLGVDFNGSSVPLHHMEIPNDAALLAEVRIDADNEGIFVDQGNILPDYSQPLVSVGTHAEVAFFPVARSPRYRVRYVGAPAPLTSDADTLPVSHVGREAVLSYVIQKLAAMNREPDRAAQAKREYGEAVEGIAAKANFVPRDQVTKRKPARAKRWLR